MWTSVSDIAAIAAAALFGATVILLLIAGRDPVFAGAKTGKPDATRTGPVFLFEGKTLVDANADALSLLAQSPQDKTDYEGMIDVLQPMFPKLTDALANPPQRQLRVDCEKGPAAWIDIEPHHNTLRLSLRGAPAEQPTSLTASLLSDVQGRELSLLREVAEQSPMLIWQTDAQGQKIWSNPAFARFDDCNRTAADELVANGHAQDKDGQTRHRLQADLQGEPMWFDITTASHGAGRLCYAKEATELMRVDANRREFVETLAKTFAELSIGLAIFDRNRRLIVFNPALVELTTIPPEFLSNRPRIDTMLDRLRELQIMPEPSDYASWREQFTAVEDGAKAGTYCKNWALTHDRTYRVTGRPHPNGAFALLFEDISAEVSLTRRFRSDIETSQAVLDTLPDGIAVFSSAGTLVISNLAYARLWSTDEDLTFQHREMRTEMNIWQDQCVPTPIWSRMRDVVGQFGQRKPWSDTALLLDGRNLRCQATPLAGGMLLVRFVIVPPLRPRIKDLASAPRVISAGQG
ncbi:MAG: PAS-domain containing protein [Pseudomonadota bacterium]